MASKAEQQLAELLAGWYYDPLGFVLGAYPWGEPGGPLAMYTGPDKWQREFLTQLGQEVRKRKFDGVHAVPPIRMARASGHGCGKSVLSAWLVNWIMSTRPSAHGTITANTFTQLSTKTWAAVQKWTKMSITAHMFEVTGDLLYAKSSKENWFCSAQTCREENSESFAGQHAADSTSFYLFDEASAVPDKIFEVAEGGLTDGEPMMFLFGNPTRNQGKFYRVCFGDEQKRWNVGAIDSRDCLLSNKAQIEEWRQDHGEDSDFFRVRVRGLAPRSSDLQFIDQERVYEAQRRTAYSLPDDPLIVGVDLARGGEDNVSFWFRRGQDARSIKPIVIPGADMRDSMLLVSKILHVMDTEYDGQKPTVAFVDGTGGMGAIVDRCRQMGYRNVIEVQFGGKPPDPRCRNMRAYMWMQMRDWLQKGAIPKDAALESELTSPGFKHDAQDKLVLESKEEIKRRGDPSPDRADSLALTFAQPVGPSMRKPKEEHIVYSTQNAGLGWMV